MIANEKERSFSSFEKNLQVHRRLSSHGASSRDDAQGRFRRKHNQDEERARKYTVPQMDREMMWREVKSLPTMKLSIELSWQVIQSRNSPSSLSDNLVC